MRNDHPDSIEPIGFNHFFNRGEPLGGFPYPDALHLVVVARATSRAADDWTDSEGYELSSCLVPLADAAAGVGVNEAPCIPFLEAILGGGSFEAGAAT